eukprot:10117603-Lingulodinium_polyedra.AAC.1
MLKHRQTGTRPAPSRHWTNAQPIPDKHPMKCVQAKQELTSCPMHARAASVGAYSCPSCS